MNECFLQCMKKWCVLVLLVVFVSCSKTAPLGSDRVLANEANILSGGMVFFVLKDKPAALQSESFTITVEKIGLRQNNSWTDVPVNAVFDLAHMHVLNQELLLAQKAVPAGVYDAVRLVYKKVLADNQEVFAPGNEVVISGDIAVMEKTSKMLVFDVLLDESLHETVEGELVFAPMVKLTESLVRDVRISSDRSVQAVKSKEKFVNRVGMNVQGKTGVGVGIWRESELVLDDGVLTVKNAVIQVPELFEVAERIPLKRVSVQVFETAINPKTIELEQNKTILLSVVSADKNYGFEIKDLGIDLLLQSKQVVEQEVTPAHAGTFLITCSSPCYGREGKVFGRVVVK